jgi:hypothetical protein
MRFTQDRHEGASARIGHSIGSFIVSISAFVKRAIAGMIHGSARVELPFAPREAMLKRFSPHR